MKSVLSNRKKTCWIIALVILVIVAVAAIVIVDALKKGGSEPKDNAYTSYYDDSGDKEMEKTVSLGSEEISIKYVRTENLKEQPLSKRADSYGTYDVYADAEGTEYLYLVNSNICCGFRKDDTGAAMDEDEAISEAEALAVADEYLSQNRENKDEYNMFSCEYSEQLGYYDIKYYRQACGYKTDDILKIWVNAEGSITAVSEFNYKRYDDLSISKEQYEKADSTLVNTIANDKKSSNKEVVDTYISMDDSGRVVLVKQVNIELASGDGTVTQSELFSQPVK